MISLRLATQEDQSLYKNLFNLLQDHLAPYEKDLNKVDAEGYYDSETISCYFNQEESIKPYVIMAEGQTAGLVILSKAPYVKPGCDYCIQELFVLGAYRGKGVAQAACKQLMQNFQGKYGIMVLKGNTRALKFWRSFIEKEMVFLKEEDLEDQSIAIEFNTK